MGFYPLKISLADKTTGLPITTYDNLNLRLSPFSVAEYAQLSKSGGTYEFGSVGDPILPGDYKLYDDATELTAFGIIRIGEPDAVLLTEDNTISGDNTFSGANTFTGLITADNINISGDVAIATGGNLTVADAPVASTDVVRKTDLADYAVLDGGNEFNDTQVFQGNVSFENAPPTCATAPTSSSHLANKTYVDSVSVIPFQESSNKRRLIPDGTQQTNKVYTTWSAVQTNASSYSGPNWRINIEIPGAGESSNAITVTGDFEDYNDINYQKVTLNISDTAYTTGALGNVTVADVTISRDGTGGDPSFENFRFKNVRFDLDETSLSFINCEFDGVCKVANTGTISFDSNCIGGVVATNGAITARMFGHDGLTLGDF